MTMRVGELEKRPFQFGIFAIFVLMTAVAMGVGVVLLPIERYWRLLLVSLIASIYTRWATRKYREQRFAAIITTDKFYMVGTAGVILALLILIVVVRFWYHELKSDPFSQRVVFGVGGVIVVIGTLLRIRRIWKLYFAPLPPDPPASATTNTSPPPPN